MPFSSRMQLALARSRGYALLADVVARGLTAESLPPLRAVADLADLLPDTLDEDATEQHAAEHYAVFGLNLFACESIFVDPESRLAGDAAARVQAAYAAVGFRPLPGHEVDSLVNELGCLAFLCGAEADAWEDQRTLEAQRVRRLQCAFLQSHLLAWLPPLCEALERQPSPLYAALAPLLLTLSMDHYSEVAPLAGHQPEAGAERAAAADREDAAAAAGVPVALPAAADDTGIKELCRRLLTPAISGLFLARSDLTQLAHTVDLPTSFGDRSRMLADLFHAAGRFERVPALLNALDKSVAAAAGRHAALVEEAPTAAPLVAPWLERLDASRALLADMRRAALEQPASPAA
jgi:TorA maturation chaperone TorD